MAERRMFAKTIIDSDAFLDMPQSSQLLYFHLSMRADDEGFINNPKSIMRNVGCKDDDIKLLIAKKFIIPFESGVVVIKHWKIHNYIQKDRFTPTKYKEERDLLGLDENKAYTQCIQDVYKLDTQDRLGKDRLGKDSKEIGEESTGKRETYVSVIESYTSCTALQSALRDYVEMRQKTKGFTVKALKLNLNTLDKYGESDEEKLEIVNRSVEHSWKGFYELKPAEKKLLKNRVAPMPTYEAPEPEEDPAERILKSYESTKSMAELFGNDEEMWKKVENLRAMFKDLTGHDIDAYTQGVTT